jgi:hypothetical protein
VSTPIGAVQRIVRSAGNGNGFTDWSEADFWDWIQIAVSPGTVSDYSGGQFVDWFCVD